MRGTIVCGVTDSDEGHAALELGVELSRAARLAARAGACRRGSCAAGR